MRRVMRMSSSRCRRVLRLKRSEAWCCGCAPGTWLPGRRARWVAGSWGGGAGTGLKLGGWVFRAGLGRLKGGQGFFFFCFVGGEGVSGAGLAAGNQRWFPVLIASLNRAGCLSTFWVFHTSQLMLQGPSSPKPLPGIQRDVPAAILPRTKSCLLPTSLDGWST